MSATRSSPSVPRGASGRSSIHADRPKYRQNQAASSSSSTTTSKSQQQQPPLPQPSQQPVVPPLRGLPVVASPTLSPRDPRDAPRVRRAVVAPQSVATDADVGFLAASEEDEELEETEAEIGLQMRQRVYSSASASPYPSPDRSSVAVSRPSTSPSNAHATPLELLQEERRANAIRRQAKQHHALSPKSRRKFDSLQQELAELSEASARASPAASDDDNEDDNAANLHVDLQPIDTTRLALEAEIARLQKLVQQPATQISSVAAPPASNAYVQEVMDEARVEASAAASSAAASPPMLNGTSSTRHRTPSSSAVAPSPSPSLQQSRGSAAITPSRPQYASRARARQRVLAREETLKEYLFNTTRLWSLLLLRAALIQLEAIRGSRAVRSLLSLPFVRGIITNGCDISLSVISTILHSKLFRFLPFSELIRNILLDESLHSAWNQLTPLPNVDVLPLTQGPLRPAFQIASYLPFSSWFFTLDPPMLAIKDEAPVEEAVDRHRRSPKALLPAAPASVNSAASSSSFDSTASIAASSPSPVTSNALEATSPLPSEHPFFTELLTRLESQAALIAFLQQDRQSLRSTIDTLRDQQDQLLVDMDNLALEKKQLEISQTASAAVHPNGIRNRKSTSVQLEMSAPIECIDIPSTKQVSKNEPSAQSAVPPTQLPNGHVDEASTSNSSFVSAAASAQLNALQLENIELRGLASAQESSVAAQEAVIQAMTEEAEVLAERIYELEEALTEEKKRNGSYVPPHDG